MNTTRMLGTVKAAVLEIHITGQGNIVKKITINDHQASKLSATAAGKQVVKIEMEN